MSSREALSGVEGLVDLHEELQEDVPQIQVEVDLQKAGRFRLARFGVSIHSTVSKPSSVPQL
jgi:Cu/Ag efflux pump CusA